MRNSATAFFMQQDCGFCCIWMRDINKKGSNAYKEDKA